MPSRNGVLTTRFDKFWSQCHSKRDTGITISPSYHPSQIRTPSRSNPASSSVLLFKLLQAANSLHLTCGNFLPPHLESWWGRASHEDKFSELEELKGGGRIQAREMPGRWDSPGKQGFAGPPLLRPFPQPSPPLYSGLPDVRTQPQNSRLCSPLPSAPPTHSVGFSLPH